MKEQEKEASDVISKWEESYAVLEARHSELSAALEANEADSEALSALQVRLDETQAALDSTQAKLSEGEKAEVDLQGIPLHIGLSVLCVHAAFLHSLLIFVIFLPNQNVLLIWDPRFLIWRRILKRKNPRLVLAPNIGRLPYLCSRTQRLNSQKNYRKSRNN